MSPLKSRSAARRTVGGLLMAGAALIWALGSSPALAAAGDSGDPRATSFPGNAVTCADAGLPGQILIGSGNSDGASNALITVVSDGTYLDVTVQPGVTVTGAVVKGGPNFNVYPGALFVDGSENDLHAPLVGQNDNVPTISHWFICGTIGGTTTATTTTRTTATTTTGTTTTGTTTTGTTTTGTTTTGTTTTGTTTTAGGGGGLPITGSPVAALGMLALGLLVVGAVLLIAPSRLLRAPKH